MVGRHASSLHRAKRTFLSGRNRTFLSGNDIPRRTAFRPDTRSGRLAGEEVAMKYKVALHRSDEGISVSVPALPGCWSEGDTEEEALANIRDAIQEYLAAL
jgi:hypothetical protein